MDKKLNKICKHLELNKSDQLGSNSSLQMNSRMKSESTKTCRSKKSG